jgi:hypothetical protein
MPPTGVAYPGEHIIIICRSATRIMIRPTPSRYALWWVPSPNVLASLCRYSFVPVGTFPTGWLVTRKRPNLYSQNGASAAAVYANRTQMAWSIFQATFAEFFHSIRQTYFAGTLYH